MSNNPTARQLRLHAKVRDLGCMACLKEGNSTPCSIHHLKEWMGKRNHDLVYGLCFSHHQHQEPGVPCRHANRKEFEDHYGTDRELYTECMQMIGEKPYEF